MSSMPFEYPDSLISPFDVDCDSGPRRARSALGLDALIGFDARLSERGRRDIGDGALSVGARAVPVGVGFSGYRERPFFAVDEGSRIVSARQTQARVSLR
jgi:hypothetical protein